MGNTYRILVVDDNLTNRKILRGSLEKAGYEISEATDGVQAVEQACRQLPDLILLDVSMPAMDGFEVCKALKARKETSGTPVIFITAKAQASDIETAFAVGGSDYVTKPFHMGEVKARISVHLQLRAARKELEETHARLLQAQKLEAIGQLAAGIAHEINTPTQYIGDNAHFLQSAFETLAPLLEKARTLARAVGDGAATQELVREFERALADADIEYLTTEIPQAFANTIDGIQRVSHIVQAMKEFSHPGVKEKKSIDINHAIESTLVVSTNEWKYVADVETDLAPDMPPVPCIPGELNQVVLNLIVNAAHAIGAQARVDGGKKGRITVRTRRGQTFGEIRIEDTGTGIAPEVRERIFEPFFTTKEVGKGTGQGLFIAHNIIVKKHGGTIGFETEVGKGTVFIIRLPLESTLEQTAAA